MKKSIPKDQKSTQASIKLGSIVSSLAHPYFSVTSEEDSDILDNPKITAYNKSTPPLMIVTEKRGGRKYNETTGKKEVSSYRCIYYSIKKGNYETYWFKSYELKLIREPQECFYDKNEEAKSLKQLKKDLIGESAVLSSVDLELNKKELYQQGNEDATFFKQKALLDFLPPVSTIIQVSSVEESKKHDDKTGSLIFSKGAILVKLRWFNSKTLKYSEEEIPLQALKKAELNPREGTYEKGETFMLSLEDKWKLEDNPKLKVKALPLSFHDIIFQHYRYQYRFKNLLDNTWFFDDKKEVNQKKIDLEDFNSSFDNSNPLNSENPNPSDWKNNWYKIGYLDKSYRYTQRIIYVREIKYAQQEAKKEERKKEPVLIIANCLLRKGKTRHFRTAGIIKSQEVSDGFEGDFIEKGE